MNGLRPGRESVVKHHHTCLLLVLSLIHLSCGSEKHTVTVYAASSLSAVLDTVVDSYHKKSGTRVLTRLESSARLGMEIEKGAPADIFISADIEWMDQLSEKGLITPGSARLLAWNRLVFVVPNSATAATPSNYLALTILDRIAMGDPETVPIGKYTRQALIEMGAWDKIQDRLVIAHSARAVLALVERREIEGGFVYASDARSSDRVKIAFEIEDQTHQPIVYPAALIKDSPHPKEARRFLDFLSGPEGKAIFRTYGLGGA